MRRGVRERGGDNDAIDQFHYFVYLVEYYYTLLYNVGKLTHIDRPTKQYCLLSLFSFLYLSISHTHIGRQFYFVFCYVHGKIS